MCGGSNSMALTRRVSQSVESYCSGRHACKQQNLFRHFIRHVTYYYSQTKESRVRTNTPCWNAVLALLASTVLHRLLSTPKWKQSASQRSSASAAVVKIQTSCGSLSRGFFMWTDGWIVGITNRRFALAPIYDLLFARARPILQRRTGGCNHTGTGGFSLVLAAIRRRWLGEFRFRTGDFSNSAVIDDRTRMWWNGVWIECGGFRRVLDAGQWFEAFRFRYRLRDLDLK